VKKVVFLTVLAGLCLTAPSYANSRDMNWLISRVETLERENEQLRAEVLRLRQQQQYRPPYYQQNQLQELNRGLDDLGRLKGSWERLKR